MKDFTRKDNLRRHKQSHNKDKDYKCDLCEKRFLRRDYLQKHKKVHTKNPVERKFTCGTCGTTFNNVNEFRAHVKSDHPAPHQQNSKEDTRDEEVNTHPTSPVRKRSKRKINMDQGNVIYSFFSFFLKFSHFQWIPILLILEEPTPKKSRPSPSPRVDRDEAGTSWQSDPVVMPADVYIPNEAPDIREVMEHNWGQIRTRQSRRNRIQDWYNLRLESYQCHVFEQILNQILADQSTIFK